MVKHPIGRLIYQFLDKDYEIMYMYNKNNTGAFMYIERNEINLLLSDRSPFKLFPPSRATQTLMC